MTSAALIAGLAGCQTGPLAAIGGNSGGDATRAASASDSVQLVERDVEAPEVFQAKDRALWDGRPSLGGVWVAAPGVTDPERIIIRNPENGKFVIGALFKRERDNPGPPLQLSSDAATALGILAGSPTTIDVVALRREETEEPTPAPQASAPATASDAPPPPAEEIVRAGEETEPDATAPAIEPEQPRRGFFGRLFGRDRAPDPMPATAPVTASGEPAAAGRAAPAITATSLDAAPAGTIPAPQDGGLDAAYVQVGIFSVEKNAEEAAARLSEVGVAPRVLAEESNGRAFWRVVAGPATTASDRTAVIRKARDLGFADAFAVRG